MVVTTLNLNRSRAPGSGCVDFNAAVFAWFRISIGFGDRDDGFSFMDIESEVECPCRV
jgi:hypothetical protein